MVPKRKSLKLIGEVAVLPVSRKARSVEGLRDGDCPRTTVKSNVRVNSGCNTPRYINPVSTGVLVESSVFSSILSRIFLQDRTVKSMDWTPLAVIVASTDDQFTSVSFW